MVVGARKRPRMIADDSRGRRERDAMGSHRGAADLLGVGSATLVSGMQHEPRLVGVRRVKPRCFKILNYFSLSNSSHFFFV